MAEVRNVKISLKVGGCSLDIARKFLEDNCIAYKTSLNFISFRINNFTYVYFKEPISNKFTNHINITKIPSIEKIEEAILKLKDLCPIQILSQSVDNIIATCSLDRPINLKEVINKKCFVQTKYNPEQFPGLFIKVDGGTVILFHSGKIVLVGFKQLQLIDQALKQICVCTKNL